MSPDYQKYFEYVSSTVTAYAAAHENDNDSLSTFASIRELIFDNELTISKFKNVQNELIDFVKKRKFSDRDFEYFNYSFSILCKIDRYISELEDRPVPKKMIPEIKDFIVNIYAETSLYSVDKKEEEVLAKINLTYDLKRKSGCLSVILFSASIIVLLLQL